MNGSPTSPPAPEMANVVGTVSNATTIALTNLAPAATTHTRVDVRTPPPQRPPQRSDSGLEDIPPCSHSPLQIN